MKEREGGRERYRMTEKDKDPEKERESGEIERYRI